MTWEPRPVPDITPETAPYWAAASKGQLLIQHCNNCGLDYHYPRPFCPDCFSDDVDWCETTGTGEVYSFSIADSIQGWPQEDLPLVVSYVELDEGPRMISSIDANPECIAVGTRVQATFVKTEQNGIAIPIFEPLP